MFGFDKYFNQKKDGFMNKIYITLIFIIALLVGTILFILFPPKISEPNIVDNKLVINDYEEFSLILKEYGLNIGLIEENTNDFFVLSAFQITNTEQVYYEVKHQIDFQYVETPNEHYEIYIYYNNELKTYYYFSPSRKDHIGNIYGYVDYDSNHFHIGHKTN